MEAISGSTDGYSKRAFIGPFLLNTFMNIFRIIRRWIDDYKRRKLFKKRIEELRKRDPFIYK